MIKCDGPNTVIKGSRCTILAEANVLLQRMLEIGALTPEAVRWLAECSIALVGLGDDAEDMHKHNSACAAAAVNPGFDVGGFLCSDAKVWKAATASRDAASSEPKPEAEAKGSKVPGGEDWLRRIFELIFE